MTCAITQEQHLVRCRHWHDRHLLHRVRRSRCRSRRVPSGCAYGTQVYPRWGATTIEIRAKDGAGLFTPDVPEGLSPTSGSGAGPGEQPPQLKAIASNKEIAVVELAEPVLEFTAVKTRSVTFDLAIEIFETVPYSEIFDMDPADFVFDKRYNLVPVSRRRRPQLCIIEHEADGTDDDSDAETDGVTLSVYDALFSDRGPTVIE